MRKPWTPGSQDSLISESLLNSECYFPSNCVEHYNLTNNNKFNVFFLLKQFEKKCLIVEFKINVQERKLVHSNNRTVPNKDRTYEKLG